MRCPPDFRVHFQLVLDAAFRYTGDSLKYFRTNHDFDEFMESDSLLCASPRALIIAFAVRYCSETMRSSLNITVRYSIVQFLTELCGRSTPDPTDGDALRTLVELGPCSQTEFVHWLDAYYRAVV